MKKLNSAIALFVCIVLLAFSFASCGKKKNSQPSNTEAATTPATAAATEAKTDAATGAKTDAATEAKTDAATEAKTEAATDPATEPATDPVTEAPVVDFEPIAAQIRGYGAAARTFKIEYDNITDAERVAKNYQYVVGPDSVDESSTPVIEQLVYYRNKAAKELFDLTIEYVPNDDYGWGAQAGHMKTVVSGNDPDAPDLFIAQVYDINKAMKTDGIFKDVKSLPGSFFDFDTKGWMKSWMESLSFTGDRFYILGSDYFLDILRAMSVLPFNMEMMDENSEKLASAIIGDDELDDEALSTYFFDLVEDGDWTWEVLGKLCTAIYYDADGDEQNSINDTLGIIIDRYSGMQAAIVLFSSGESTTETYTIEDPESEYNGKQWVKYRESADVLGDIFEAVKGVFAGQGAFVTNDPSKEGATADNPGLPYHDIKFSNNELLFAGPAMLSRLENTTYQEMQSVYSVVPMPKVNATKEYNTIIHNTADAGAINVHTIPAKAKVISAFIQYCTQNSAEIREELLEIVTKFKTTTYDQGTDRMLDLIYERIVNARDKAIEDAAELTSVIRYHKIMMDGEFVYGRSDIQSAFEAHITEKQENLDKVLQKWYTLPIAGQ